MSIKVSTQTSELSMLVTLRPASQLGQGQRQGFDPCLNLMHGDKTVPPLCTIAQQHQARHYGCTQLSK